VGLDARAKRAREQARLGPGSEDGGPRDAPEPADAGSGPSRQAEGVELRAIVRRAVESLPEEQRLVLELVQTQGLTYREAAGILEIPLGTVKSRMSAAVETLRRRLARHVR
jgi:RNA polymerase sigma factor (sigma-70 family)